MKNQKTKVHFTDNYLLTAENPIEVNIIGAGGTGSKVLIALMEMNHSLLAFDHPGLMVRLWDDDIIEHSNLGRQRYADCEIGLYKSVALINRANRFSGTNWKAETRKFDSQVLQNLPKETWATLYMSCVDNVQARFDIAEVLHRMEQSPRYTHKKPKYWIDFGNGTKTGQVILSTVGKIEQPKSKKFEVIEKLPFVTEEYGELLRQSETKNDTPSCSLPEALAKQDLYINSTLAQMGCSLLWGMFRQGMTENKGFFLNLKNFRSLPIPI